MVNKKFTLLSSILLAILYVIPLFIFRYSPAIRRHLLFMNEVNNPSDFNFSHPDALDIKCSRTLRLINNLFEPNEPALVELGVWHILPQSSLYRCTTDTKFNRTFIENNKAFLSDDRPIILYIHGNCGSRAYIKRVALYKRWAYKYNYHIVTFDYRGFGDSTYITPSTFGMTADARFMYDWLLKQPGVSKERVHIWGHSLGTAVSVRMVAGLPESLSPNKVLLEAPFDSLANAVTNHPYSALFRLAPFSHFFLADPIHSAPELNFDSASLIKHVKRTSFMIIHAEDDAIIPFHLGYALYKVASEHLGPSRANFIKVDESLGLGHNHISDHDETMAQVDRFFNDL